MGDSWREGALCQQTDPELFHPGAGESATPALRICHACHVRTQCLEYALDTKQHWGIWGGLTQNGLRRRVRIRQAEAA